MNDILFEYQFGFRKNYSTSQAVMEVLDNIYQSCDNSETTIGIYLDLRKAFDTASMEQARIGTATSTTGQAT